MTVKLNLTVKEGNAEKIKLYAQKRKTSVSKIIDAYIESIVQAEAKAPKKKSFVEKYGGIIKGDLKDLDKVRDEYLKEKYGL